MSDQSINFDKDKYEPDQTPPPLQNEKELERKINELTKEVATTKSALDKSKFDVIAILGVFVGLITYLGLEVQVFKTIGNPLMIVGVSMFFISSILLFILTINLISKTTTMIGWNLFKNPLYLILIILLIISNIFIILGSKMCGCLSINLQSEHNISKNSIVNKMAQQQYVRSKKIKHNVAVEKKSLKN